MDRNKQGVTVEIMPLRHKKFQIELETIGICYVKWSTSTYYLECSMGQLEQLKTPLNCQN